MTFSTYAKMNDLELNGYRLEQHEEHAAAILLLNWVEVSFAEITPAMIKTFWHHPYVFGREGWLMITVKALPKQSWRATHPLIIQLDVALE